MVDNGQQESLYPSAKTVISEEPLYPGRERDRRTEFTEKLHATIRDYYSMVIDQLPNARDAEGKLLQSPRDLSPEDITAAYQPYDVGKLETAEIGFFQWKDNRFDPLRNMCVKPKDMSAITPGEARLVELQTDLRHDLASDILGGFVGAITTDKEMYEMLGYYGNPYMVQWPLHIMDRIYKQTTDTADIKPIQGQDANKFIAAVFRTLSVLESDRFSYDIDYRTPFELEGDFDYLLGVLANPLNNIKQIAKEKGLKDVKTMIKVLPDPEKDGNVIIQIRDNIGGMPEELLEVPEGTDTPRALQRGETRRQGGTGAGLAIVNEIVRDHFHGSISLKNEVYPETAQMGLVMNISLPGKITETRPE